MSSPVSEEVKECFRGRTAVLGSLKKYPADFIVAHICLVFELVYPVSLEIVKEQGYLDKMLGFRSENADTKGWFRYSKTSHSIHPVLVTIYGLSEGTYVFRFLHSDFGGMVIFMHQALIAKSLEFGVTYPVTFFRE